MKFAYPSIKIVLSLCFLVLLFYSQAQNQARNWLFGNGAALNFSAAVPGIGNSGAITTSLGCASISDANGNLLFYTDGMTVYTQSNTVMQNGTGLFGINCGQSALILKQPGAVNLYYIFTLAGASNTLGLHYSIVDMSLAAGQGSVVVKNSPLQLGACAEKLSAGLHCNGVDFWVLCYSSGFKAFCLSSAGISTAVTSTTSINMMGRGCMKISPNSRRLAAVSSIQNTANPSYFSYTVSLFAFDNSSGMVSSANIANALTNVNLPFLYEPYGVEFSADGTKLYYSIAYGALLQQDLCASTGSTTTGDLSLGNEGAGNYSLKRSMQLAPNGKLYVTNTNSTSIGVVSNPNAVGALAAFTPLGQSIGTATCQWGLPNFPGFLFEQKPSVSFSHSASPTSCLTRSFFPSAFCANTGYTLSSCIWNFGDPSAAGTNTSSAFFPTHTYPSVGTYTVELIRNFLCCRPDTIKQVITLSSPSITVLSSSMACGIASATAQLSNGVGPYTYAWSPGSTTTSILSHSTATSIYTVIGTDVGGNCAITSTVLVQNTVLVASISQINVSCFGGSNGQASITVQGGSGNYSYTWSSGTSSASTLQNVSAGNYTVAILDNTNLCSISKTLTINQAPALAVSLLTPSTAICESQSFSVAATVSGGSGSPSYTWSNGNTSANPQYTLPAGLQTISLSITDQNACVATTSQTLLVIAQPTLSINTNSVCATDLATIVASGANTYTWQPVAVFSASLINVFFNTTTLSLSGSAQGCSSTKTIVITVYPKPSAYISGAAAICDGQSLLLAGSGGNNYSWLGPNAFSSSQATISFATVSPLNAGVYTLQVQTNNGCSTSTTQLVSVIALPNLSVSGSTAICFGNSANLTVSGANTYTWSNGTAGNTILLNPATTSTYTVTGKDANGCSSTSVITVVVNKCVGIEETETDLCSISPNPATDEVVLTCAKPLLVQLYSADASLVESKYLEQGKHTFDVSRLTEGIYFLRVSTGEGKIEVLKLVLKR